MKDLFNKNTRGYNTKCLLFKHTATEHEITDKKGFVTFFSKDITPFKHTTINGGHVRISNLSGRIETQDVINIEKDDYVLIYNKKYRVIEVEQEDFEEQKGISLRIRTITRIDLVG